MADFINTIDLLGDDVVIDSIINRTITEFKDDTIETVGKYAFEGCAALETLHLPNATELDVSALYKTRKLKNIELPNVTSLGRNVFVGCGVERLRLPSVVTSGVWLFDPSGDKFLKIVDMPKLETIQGSFMGGNTSMKALLLRNTAKVCSLANLDTMTLSATVHIYVPSALYDAYCEATNWSAIKDRIHKLEDYTVDGTVTGELDETKI